MAKGKPEGEILQQMAIEADIPPHQIALTPIVRNTAEEAMALRQMIKGEKPHIILVTSAFHMPRALQLLVIMGLMLHPTPQITGRQTSIFQSSILSPMLLH